MDRKKLGLRIKVRRTELEMNQSDLADAINMKQQQLGRIERGTASLKVEQFVAIAKALQYEPTRLLDGL